MQTLRRTVLEVVILALLAGAIGFAINGVRAQGSVRFSRNYFPKVGSVRQEPSRADVAPEVLAARPVVQRTGATPAPPAAAEQECEGHECPASVDEGMRRLFRELSFDEVLAIYNDPNTERCLNVFIDARSEAVYEQGHIPGALQADHYRLDQCLDLVLPYVQGAKKVIVYCNGGDCEDSLFLCSDLSELDVPNGKLFLYRGGWVDWETRGMPVARGSTPKGN